MLRSKQVNSRKELELEEEFKPDFLSTCEVRMKTNSAIFFLFLYFIFMVSLGSPS